MTRILLEVCVDSLQSAVAAVHGGADRLELCGNLGLGGGTTPSLGLFWSIHEELPNIPIMVMIRPRTGDFVYDDTELQVMTEDIRVFKTAGAHGFVFGLLNPDGSIDEVKTSKLLAFVEEQEVCFHRAFDMTPPTLRDKNLGVIARLSGITRILTSGQGSAVPLSLQSIQDCVQLAHATSSGRTHPLSILPGSGLNARTIQQVAEALIPAGVHEFHMSGGSWVNGAMEFRKENMAMGVGGPGEWGVWRTSKDEVMNVRRVLDACSLH